MTFLRRVEQDDGVLLQGCVRSRWPSRAELGGEAGEVWDSLFEDAAALSFGIGCQSVSLALVADAAGGITTTHSFVVNSTRERQLRLVLAAFLRADSMGAANVEVPSSLDQLEDLFLLPDRSRFAASREVLPTSHGGKIFLKVRLGPLIASILRQARLLGAAATYQIAATPWKVPRELYRSALLCASNIEERGRIPESLRADQLQFVESLKGATYHVEECFGTSGGESEGILRDSLAAEMKGTAYAANGAVPQIAPVSPDVEEAMANLVHPSVMFGWPDEPSEAEMIGAAGSDEVASIVTCEELRPKAGGRSGGGTKFSRLASLSKNPDPVPPAGDRFFFVSYARGNSDAVYPILRKLAENAVPVWFDKQIRGGLEWDVELESRILSCQGILAFITPRFVRSKYCRREIKFGDALGKPLFPIMLESVQLQEGLAFLLHERQFMEAVEADFLDKLMAAVAGEGAMAATRLH